MNHLIFAIVVECCSENIYYGWIKLIIGELIPPLLNIDFDILLIFYSWRSWQACEYCFVGGSSRHEAMQQEHSLEMICDRKLLSISYDLLLSPRYISRYWTKININICLEWWRGIIFQPLIIFDAAISEEQFIWIIIVISIDLYVWYLICDYCAWNNPGQMWWVAVWYPLWLW